MSNVSTLKSVGRKDRIVAATSGAIGIVYGDLGTSPLYAFREALKPLVDAGLARTHVIGITSLMIWTVTVIVTVKYVLFLLRADNHAEGGTLALTTLIMRRTRQHRNVLLGAGMLGAALFIGDAMITPALSVLSAIEGLTVVSPSFTPYLLPIAFAVIVALFIAQAKGTAFVSRFFGPIMLIWFVVIGLGGFFHLMNDPSTLRAINPVHGLRFLWQSGTKGWLVLGAVFLTVTGAEALYSDLAHFGRRAIQLAWFLIVYPALLLSYLGQGALVLAHPEAAVNPFFLLYPDWATLPVVLLATIATVIASQAVITGTFSLAKQAIHLGLLPPMRILFTSPSNTGQIYLPAINLIMAVGVVALIAVFKSSEQLAAAYGLSVTGAMLLTTILALQYLRKIQRWKTRNALILLAPLAVIESVFLAANFLKIAEGGYLPVFITTCLLFAMWTWKGTTAAIEARMCEDAISLDEMREKLTTESVPPRLVQGTGVFLTRDPTMTPPVFLANYRFNNVVHEHVVILTVRTSGRPYVPDFNRIKIVQIDDRFSRVTLEFGYMEVQKVFDKLRNQASLQQLNFEGETTTFYVGRMKLVCDPGNRVTWRKKLFLAMAKLSQDPSDYFGLPSDRTAEIGQQMKL